MVMTTKRIDLSMNLLRASPCSECLIFHKPRQWSARKPNLVSSLAHGFLIVLIVFLAPYSANAAESHPGLANEADLAEAILAQKDRKLDLALKKIDGILARTPEELSALDLKISVLAEKKDTPDSVLEPILLKVIELRKGTPAHPSALGARSRLALIRFKAKSYLEAHELWIHVAERDYARRSSLYLAALSAMEAGEPGLAGRTFNKLIRETPAGGQTDEFGAAALFYAGRLNLGAGDGARGTQQLQRAVTAATALPESPLKNQVLKGAQEALAPLDRHYWGHDVSLTTQWDSNVSLAATSSLEASESSGYRSLKSIVNAGTSFLSSPMSRHQFALSYRINYNRNWNRLAYEYEFLTHSPSLSWVYNPIGRWSTGLRLDPSLIYQNTITSTDTSAKLRPYNQSITLTPLVRLRTDADLDWLAEIFAKPTHFSGDPHAGATVRSGRTWGGKLSVRQGGSRATKADASLGFEASGAHGTDYYSRTWGADLGADITLPGGASARLSGRGARSAYPRRSPRRIDWAWTLRGSIRKPLGRQWAATLEITELWNNSTVPDTYRYAKFTAGLNLAFSF